MFNGWAGRYDTHPAPYIREYFGQSNLCTSRIEHKPLRFRSATAASNQCR